MLGIAPHHICRWFGHRRELYNAGQFTDRRGRWRTRWHSRCTRCGTSDGGEVFNPGIMERWHGWRLHVLWWRLRDLVRWGWLQRCEDCGKPTVRFWRQVGKHEDCDVIPF